MADENTTPIEDMQAYQQARVAYDFLQSEKDIAYVPGASINLGRDLGLSGPATVYEEAIRASPEATQRLIELSTKRYQDSRSKSKIGDLFDLYVQEGKVNDNASEGDVDKVKGLFGSYLEKTVGDIEEEIGDAEYVLNSRTNSNDEEKRVARETIENRKKLLGKLQVFENYYLEEGRQRAVRATIKPTLESMLKDSE